MFYCISGIVVHINYRRVYLQLGLQVWFHRLGYYGSSVTSESQKPVEVNRTKLWFGSVRNRLIWFVNLVAELHQHQNQYQHQNPEIKTHSKILLSTLHPYMLDC